MILELIGSVRLERHTVVRGVVVIKSRIYAFIPTKANFAPKNWKMFWKPAIRLCYTTQIRPFLFVAHAYAVISKPYRYEKPRNRHADVSPGYIFVSEVSLEGPIT